MFYVGQKVVCVDDQNWRSGGADGPAPRRGEIYTIAVIGELDNGSPAVGLVEVTPINSRSDRAWYFSKRFRPAVERKTSIEIFTRMLNPSKERVTV